MVEFITSFVAGCWLRVIPSAARDLGFCWQRRALLAPAKT
jgi:hypothetical protein